MQKDEPLQLAINKLYIKLCEEGDIENLKGIFHLYKPKKTSSNPIFSYFLNIGQNFRTSIDPHCQNNEAFKKACKNSHTEVLKFLIKIPNFINNINKKEDIYSAFKQALITENISVVKLLHPLLKKNRLYFTTLYDGFTDSCYRGKFDSVKYLLTDESINFINLPGWITNCDGTHSTLLAGFIAACEGSGEKGHPNVVKYLTSVHSEIDFSKLQRHVNISNIEIMQHFIFDLGLNRDDPLMKKIYFNDSIELNKLFEKKDLFHNLESNLNINGGAELKQTNKRLKL